VAFLLATAGQVAAQVAIPNLCKLYEPWSWDWILAGCYLYDVAQVLFGPFVNGHSGFLLR
jgi:hypothetical protein